MDANNGAHVAVVALTQTGMTMTLVTQAPQLTPLVTPVRVLLCGLGLSVVGDVIPWSYCMSGDAYGLPFPIVYPRHGEDSMLLGWVTGTQGGGEVVDLSAVLMNASVCVALTAVVAFGYVVVARMRSRSR